MIDPYVIVRSGSVFLCALLTLAACVRQRPTARALGGAVLASIWNIPAVLAIHLGAMHFGWWRFEAQGGLLLGMPVDLYLAWAWLWGAVPALAFRTMPLTAVVSLALAADLVLMPLAAPVVRLQPNWLAGEAAALAVCFLPAQLLARWTALGERLIARAVLQVLAFGGLVLLAAPAMVLEGSGSEWFNPFDRPTWQLSLIVQVMAVPAIVGLSAVQEFVTRGRGTPVPFDPPRQLVATGVYAYLRNPMQLSGIATLVLLGIALHNIWICLIGVMTHVYSIGLAGWDEEEDLRRRFGEPWVVYKRHVSNWIPRLRPWFPPDDRPSRFYVAASCAMCSEVGRWFEQHHARELIIVPAETHPSGALTRVRYERADGSGAADGVEAIARALEHVNLGWAMLAFAIRLPLVRPVVQLLADASGAEPRAIGRRLSH